MNQDMSTLQMIRAIPGPSLIQMVRTSYGLRSLLLETEIARSPPFTEDMCVRGSISEIPLNQHRQ